MRRFTLVLGMMLMVVGLPLAAGDVPMEKSYWEGPEATFMPFLGRKAMTGFAMLKDGELRDGRIEVELAATGERGYPGVMFHIAGEGEYETVYVRPHKSNLPDTVQYAPSNKGMVDWQLYAGEGYTARALLPKMQWMKLVLEIRGRWADFYVDGEHIMKMPLKHQGGGSGIALNAYPLGQAWYSNFKFTPATNVIAEAALVEEIADGTVVDWELSPLLDTETLNAEVYPGKSAADTWTKVKAEGPGFVNISKVHAKNKRWNTVLARATVRADRNKRVRLNLGYSDRVDVWVNGQKVFHGNDEFQSHDDTFLGIVGLNDSVYVDLKKGENEIMTMVHERFGGWAVWAQIEELSQDAVR